MPPKAGRPLIGDKPLSNTERAQRSRAKKRAEMDRLKERGYEPVMILVKAEQKKAIDAAAKLNGIKPEYLYWYLASEDIEAFAQTWELAIKDDSTRGVTTAKQLIESIIRGVQVFEKYDLGEAE